MGRMAQQRTSGVRRSSRFRAPIQPDEVTSSYFPAPASLWDDNATLCSGLRHSRAYGPQEARMKIPREFAPYARQAVLRGWRVEPTKNLHLKWIAPSGAIIFSSSTPSDRRAALNLRSQLRREGLDV